MLPAANRMRAAADFAHTTRRGTKVTRGSVVVYVATADDATGDDASAQPRVGLVVSKAVGNSVVRHRVSRRIRGAVRSLLPSLPGGSRVVVRALPGAEADRGLAQAISDAVSTGLARRTGGQR
jgi:ribonuclease P protein component